MSIRVPSSSVLFVWLSAASLFCGSILPPAQAFVLSSHWQHGGAPLGVAAAAEDGTFVAPDMARDYDISDPYCVAAASLMRRIDVPVPESVSSSGTAGISYVHWPASSVDNNNNKKKTLPLLLVHGFDSSCLEFRRLGPALAALGVDTYAVDLLGWGFTRLDDDVRDCSADAKVAALRGFWRTIAGDAPVCIGGASLGGASAIEFASSLSSPNTPAHAVVLLDAQGFTDGIGPPSLLPPFLARLGVKVLKSERLRNAANRMSYFDRETFATDDALKTGRSHCLFNENGWEDAQLNFIKSGGFYPSQKVPGIAQKTLVLWGREDGILEGTRYAGQFMDALPDAELQWIEKCGHVPHIEQAETTASIIRDFLEKEELLVER